MSEYPLQLRVYSADFTQPEPSSKVSEHIVDGRYGNDDEEFTFYIIDPYNGNELGVYASVEEGSAVHDTSMFYWVDEVMHNRDEA